MNNPDAMADFFHGIQNVRGEDNRGPAGAPVLKYLLEAMGAFRVEAIGGLVQQKQLGLSYERRRQRNLLPHAMRVIGNQLAGFILHAKIVQQLFDPPSEPAF